MTVEEAIYAVLGPLVGGRVFPDVAPLDTPKPYITYSQVGGQSISYVENTVPDLKHGRFQFDMWCATRKACSALALQVESTLILSNALIARPEGAFTSRHDPDLNIYSAMQDFSIHSPR